ncbi:MAG: fumarylacetoacetate hydrolase family protein [Chloroflexota bacterium]|nr:fumarylacetoacetate hydrolase family protein [Chloroflexota bacterium]
MRLYAYQDRYGLTRTGALVDGLLITGGQLARFERRQTSRTRFGPCCEVIATGWQRDFERTVRRAVRGDAKRRSPDARRPMPAVRLPEKIVCVGLNYADHAAEGGRAAPGRPLLFAKFGNAIVGDGEAIVRPPGTRALDLEVELGVVIGRRARRVTPDQAMAHVAGYVVVNDISARDWQGNPQALREGEKGDGQWLRAKGSDTFLPVGPVLVTPDELDPAEGVRLRSWRIPGSGPDAGTPVLMQDGNTADMLVGVAGLVSYISQQITLEAGDLIATGTPAGVGVFRDPPVFLEPGDRVRCEIEGIGMVENPIVDWTDDPRQDL